MKAAWSLAWTCTAAVLLFSTSAFAGSPAGSPAGSATSVAASGTAKAGRYSTYYGMWEVRWHAHCAAPPGHTPLIWFVSYQATGARSHPALSSTGTAVAGSQSVVGQTSTSGTFTWFVALDKGLSRETFHGTVTLLCSGKHTVLGHPQFTVVR